MDDSQNQNLISVWLKQLKAWSAEHKIAAGSIVVLVITFIGFGFAVFSYLPEPVKQLAFSPEPETPNRKFYSPLSGEQVKTRSAQTRQVTGIMIENSPAARPQSGMLGAGVVYEAIAEAGITRFLAIYQENQPNLIGPVRSLRPYYVNWLAPYDASYAHVGGSLKALQQVRSDGYKDIDQFFNPEGYYRSSDRYPPHNVYTTFDRLNQVNKKRGFKKSVFEAWPRKPDAPLVKPKVTRIDVNISSATYNSNYTYRKSENDYLRFQGGGKHVNRENNRQLNPDVVIVMKVNESLVMEDGLRENIKTTGSGDAYIFQDGQVTQATWQKKGTRKPLKFIANDKEVQLNTGQVWVTAVPIGQNVTWD